MHEKKNTEGKIYLSLSLSLSLKSVVALGHGGFGGNCGGARGGCVRLGMGFQEEHNIGLGLVFEEHGCIQLGLGFKEEHTVLRFGSWLWSILSLFPLQLIIMLQHCWLCFLLLFHFHLFLLTFHFLFNVSFLSLFFFSEKKWGQGRSL